MTIIDIITAKQDIAHSLYRTLTDMEAAAGAPDGSYTDGILAQYQSIIDAGRVSDDAPKCNESMAQLMGWFSAGTIYNTDDIRDSAAADFRAAIEAKFFGGISRNDMVSLLRIMASNPDATLTIAQGMEYFSTAAAHTWNRCNTNDTAVEA